MMGLRGNTFCVALFSGIRGLERLLLTLFNLCVANFLTTIAQSTRVAMMGIMPCVYLDKGSFTYDVITLGGEGVSK